VLKETREAGKSNWSDQSEDGVQKNDKEEDAYEEMECENRRAGPVNEFQCIVDTSVSIYVSIKGDITK